MIISLILCLIFFTMSSWVKFCMKVKHFIPIKSKCKIPLEQAQNFSHTKCILKVKHKISADSPGILHFILNWNKMFDFHTKYYPLSSRKDENVSRFIQLILSVMIYSIRHFILNWNKMFDLHTKLYPLPARKDKIVSKFIQLILSVMIYSIRKNCHVSFDILLI